MIFDWFFKFQFERDGYMVFDDFFTPAEVAEMLKAGRHLCAQAPKEERKIFSTTDSESTQVGVWVQNKVKLDFTFFYVFLEPRQVFHRIWR